MNKVELAIFAPTLEAGIGKFVYNLSQELVRRGRAVEVVAMKQSVRDIPDNQISVFNLDTKRAYKSLIPLIRYLKLKRPKVLLTAVYYANLIAIMAKFLSGSKVRVVATEHVPLKQELKRLSALQRVIYQILFRFVYRFADQVVASSEGVKADLLHFGLPANKVSLIRYPIINDQMFELARAPIGDLPGDKEAPVVLGVGRLTEQKDFRTLILAFSKVVKKNSCRLMIIGDGPEKQMLQELIESERLGNSVFLLGHKDNHYPYYHQAKLFVLSSKYEGLGIVIVEALALGVPVVSTDCPSGPGEILGGKNFGQLVPVGDADALAGAIENFLSNPPTRPKPEDLNQFSSKTSGDLYERILFH